jgi:hypothetical protein
MAFESRYFSYYDSSDEDNSPEQVDHVHNRRQATEAILSSRIKVSISDEIIGVTANKTADAEVMEILLAHNRDIAVRNGVLQKPVCCSGGRNDRGFA